MISPTDFPLPTILLIGSLIIFVFKDIEFGQVISSVVSWWILVATGMVTLFNWIGLYIGRISLIVVALSSVCATALNLRLSLKDSRFWNRFLGSAVILVVYGLLHLAQLSKYARITADSITYRLYSNSVTLGNLDHMSIGDWVKRPVGGLVLYLASVRVDSHVYLNVLVGLGLSSALYRACRKRIENDLWGFSLGVLTPVFFISTPLSIFMVLYFNAHFTVAFLLFSVQWLSWHEVGSKHQIALLSSALVLLRPEMAFVLLVWFALRWLSNHEDNSVRLGWPLLVVSSIHLAYLIAPSVVFSASFSSLKEFVPSVLMVALYYLERLGALGLAPRSVEVAHSTLLKAVGSGVILIYMLVNSDVRSSFRPTFLNLFMGSGQWGTPASLVVGLGVAWVIFFVCFSWYSKIPLNADQKFLVSTGVLIIALFCTSGFRNGSFRVGTGDSFNRMFFHIWPSLLYGIVVVGVGLLFEHRMKKSEFTEAVNTR
jgi:hypothetical protein